MNSISVCMIAKNEEKNVEKCLKPLKELGFEIVVADTGSTDQTKALISNYTNRIYSYSWTNDFSAARNFVISKATNDWILVVDFDEYLEDSNLAQLLPFAIRDDRIIGTVTRRNPCQLLNGKHSVMREQVARFFHRGFCHYEGIIHEQVLPIDGSEPNYQSIPLCFYHHGYEDASVLKQKAQRNLTLLEQVLKSQPNDPYILYQIGKCYQVMKNFTSACEYFNLGLSKDIDPALSYVQDMIEAYGYCLLDKQDYTTALGLTAVYDTFSRQADFVFLIGLIYMNNGMFDLAIQEFEKAATIPNVKTEGINSYLAYYNAGVICECLALTEKAKNYYKKCGDYAFARERLVQLSTGTN